MGLSEHSTQCNRREALISPIYCRSPTELPVQNTNSHVTVQDYRQEIMFTLSSAALEIAQKHYKASYNRRADDHTYEVGEWILICFPSEETHLRKLSRPWHGPYCITSCNAVKVYFPLEEPIQVHQLRMKPCPQGFPADYYWCETRRKGPGRPP